MRSRIVQASETMFDWIPHVTAQATTTDYSTCRRDKREGLPIASSPHKVSIVFPSRVTCMNASKRRLGCIYVCIYVCMYAGYMHVCIALEAPLRCNSAESVMMPRAEAKGNTYTLNFPTLRLLTNKFPVRRSPDNRSVKSKYHVYCM